jgi:hypothetical protein
MGGQVLAGAAEGLWLVCAVVWLVRTSSTLVRQGWCTRLVNQGVWGAVLILAGLVQLVWFTAVGWMF